jgi:hypothetical protein
VLGGCFAALFFVLNPLDLIPDFIPGHGKPFTRERLQKTYAEKKK